MQYAGEGEGRLDLPVTVGLHCQLKQGALALGRHGNDVAMTMAGAGLQQAYAATRLTPHAPRSNLQCAGSNATVLIHSSVSSIRSSALHFSKFLVRKYLCYWLSACTVPLALAPRIQSYRTHHSLWLGDDHRTSPEPCLRGNTRHVAEI